MPSTPQNNRGPGPQARQVKVYSRDELATFFRHIHDPRNPVPPAGKLVRRGLRLRPSHTAAEWKAALDGWMKQQQDRLTAAKGGVA